ncbi:hypothetical protein [Mesorhizobium silamurunense]|uniref:hypothetical protein n=1 Tax=Mesorhizobium silamurunense TaxID=499528 RepID=UPI00177DD31F|nr:hypothetical protein [Mesorhizobium silamurunense]
MTKQAKPRLSWATRPLPPVTVADIERYLDTVARLMDKAGRKADLYLPIWRRLQRELEKRKEADALLAEARARLTRSQAKRSTDQISARSA